MASKPVERASMVAPTRMRMATFRSMWLQMATGYGLQGGPLCCAKGGCKSCHNPEARGPRPRSLPPPGVGGEHHLVPPAACRQDADRDVDGLLQEADIASRGGWQVVHGFYFL